MECNRVSFGGSHVLRCGEVVLACCHRIVLDHILTGLGKVYGVAFATGK